MEDDFQWSVQDNNRVIAWPITDLERTRGETPKKSTTDSNICTLTLYTLATEVKLAQHRGFMSQNNQTWTDHIFYKMHHPFDRRSIDRFGVARLPPRNQRDLGIFPDAGTLSSSGSYKLVRVGTGWDSSVTPPKAYFVVLLVEKEGDSYERRGLSVVPEPYYPWTFQWIDIV
ncbi:hypothetical protein E8E13_001974 [Curvularia kusanoi]|uniref:Uncharacterized protein n=1 Tax=Curvularia kusanoi TaxID=90978 RepID=A0A9P4TC09_CURKU|nr:hypothetical protein E8E13_001974 [Curvularia kusanoi]